MDFDWIIAFKKSQYNLLGDFQETKLLCGSCMGMSF
ncbi:hypothetical protein A1S_3663 [Acinetobacter baumannii ATCC 17978]|nr:hypothetical protein A1S_3663 [Acinetobacter baumannii ATCC 17978]